MPPEIGRSDPNWAFTRQGREERLAEIDRSLGYEPSSPGYAATPPAAAQVAQPVAPAAPVAAPGWAGQPYPGWQPPQQPAAQPDPAAAERERAQSRERELEAQLAQYQGVFQYIQNDLRQREWQNFLTEREGLDPETAIAQTDARYQQILGQMQQAWQNDQANNRAALMSMHAEGFTQELFNTLSLTDGQRQAVRDIPVNAADPEPGANARASLAAAFHEINERQRQLAYGNGVAIYAASGINRVGGLSPAGSGPGQPLPGQSGYHRNPVVREIMAAPYLGVRQ